MSYDARFLEGVSGLLQENANAGRPYEMELSTRMRRHIDSLVPLELGAACPTTGDARSLVGMHTLKAITAKVRGNRINAETGKDEELYLGIVETPLNDLGYEPGLGYGYDYDRTWHVGAMIPASTIDAAAEYVGYPPGEAPNDVSQLEPRRPLVEAAAAHLAMSA